MSTVESTPATTHFTSAIMRNQRPPNVNVGPDGLNISQPMLMSGPNAPPNASVPPGPGQPWYRPTGPGGPPGGPNSMYLRQNSAPMNSSSMMNANGPGSPMNTPGTFGSPPPTMNHGGGGPGGGPPPPSRQMSMGSPGPNMMVPVGGSHMGPRGPHPHSSPQYFPSSNSHPHGPGGGGMPAPMIQSSSQMPPHGQMQTQVQQQLTMQSNQQQISINGSQQSSMQMHVSSSVTMAAQQTQMAADGAAPTHNQQQQPSGVNVPTSGAPTQNASFGNSASNAEDFSLDFLDNPFPETSPNDLFDSDFNSLLDDLVP